MNALFGLVAIGGALVASRRSRRMGLGAAPVAQPGTNTSESLHALLRAADSLYGHVDRPRAGPADFQWEDPDYIPSCGTFTEDAGEALLAAILAENAGEPQAYSVKVAALQAWALSQMECGGEEPEAFQGQAEQSLTPG